MSKNSELKIITKNMPLKYLLLLKKKLVFLLKTIDPYCLPKPNGSMIQVSNKNQRDNRLKKANILEFKKKVY